MVDNNYKNFTSNFISRKFLQEGCNSFKIGNFTQAEEEWKQSSTYATSTSCYDPGAYFLASSHLARLFLVQNRLLEANIMVQLALRVYNNIFSQSTEVSDSLKSIVNFLKGAEHQLVGDSDVASKRKYTYTKQDLLHIKESMNLSNVNNK